MEERIQNIPKKCASYFLAKIFSLEREGKNIEETIKNIRNSQEELYALLRSRFSGKITEETFFKEYKEPTGKHHKEFTRLKENLLAIKEIELETPNITKEAGKSGWTHFIINKKEEKRLPYKAYITTDYNTFSYDAFKEVLLTLEKEKFSGQIKVLQPENTKLFFLQDDNIVLHTENQESLEIGTRVVLSTLTKKGVKIGGSSFQSNATSAKDITIPKLAMLSTNQRNTSFNEGMSLLACEFVLLSLEKNKENLSFEILKRLINELFARDGPFDKYIKEHYAN
ncbi:MAG: hypothetical protein H6500_00345 [Candidatus Woesearchaeota archaeon]|nr:MAG: hypothetical protein H6500_00345 [Candidatus Woesearchaeota archaeon]